MILTTDISSVHIATGMATRRCLLHATDRWGKRFFVDASRWMDGRMMLMAYKKTGEPLWQKGHAWMRAQCYARENIVSVED